MRWARQTEFVPPWATMTILHRSSSTCQSLGSPSSRLTPCSPRSPSRAVVTRSWKRRNDSPPGRPSHHSSGVRCREVLKISMTASSVTPCQFGIWISRSESTVSISSPVSIAIGTAVSWERVAGETIKDAAGFFSVAIRLAASSDCWRPNSVRFGSRWEMPLMAHCGCPWRTKSMSTDDRLMRRGREQDALGSK